MKVNMVGVRHDLRDSFHGRKATGYSVNELMMEKIRAQTIEAVNECKSPEIQQIGDYVFMLLDALNSAYSNMSGQYERISAERKKTRDAEILAHSRGLKIQSLCYPEQVDLDGNLRDSIRPEITLGRGDG